MRVRREYFDVEDTSGRGCPLSPLSLSSFSWPMGESFSLSLSRSLGTRISNMGPWHIFVCRLLFWFLPSAERHRKRECFYMPEIPASGLFKHVGRDLLFLPMRVAALLHEHCSSHIFPSLLVGGDLGPVSPCSLLQHFGRPLFSTLRHSSLVLLKRQGDSQGRVSCW